MYNFNYEYMTFLYAVHVYMFCNVVLYCIALPARGLFAIKIIIIINIPLSIWDFILRFVGISLSSREFMTRSVGKVCF